MIFVSGDTGWAVFSTTWNPTWDYEWEKTSPEYFAEKCQAFFQDKFVLDQEKAENNITDHIISTLNCYDYTERESKRLAKEVIRLAGKYSDWDSVEDFQIFTRKDRENILKASFMILNAIYSSISKDDWVIKIQENENFSDCMDAFYDHELYNVGTCLHQQFEMWIYELRMAKKQLEGK